MVNDEEATIYSEPRWQCFSKKWRLHIGGTSDIFAGQGRFTVHGPQAEFAQFQPFLLKNPD